METAATQTDAQIALPRSINLSKMLLSVIGGVLFTLSFPKMGLSLLAWVALIPLLLAIRDVTPGAAFRLGMVFGLAHFLSLLYWVAYTLKTYGYLPLAVAIPILFLLCTYMALYPAAAAWAAARVCRHPLAFWLGFPTLWTALEFCRTHVLTGFPWGLAAYSQYRILPMIQSADITGPYGISFIVVLVNAALTGAVLCASGKMWQGRPFATKDRAIALAGAAALVGLSACYGLWRIHDIEAIADKAPVLRSAVVQGNIAQDKKWDPAFQIAATKTYIDKSVNLTPQSPELVVWPETATPFYLFDNAVLTRMVQRAVKKTSAYFLIGSPAMQLDGDTVQLFNSAYLVAQDGEPLGRYDKAHLVPYGEYVPLRRWMPFVGKMVAQIGDFTPGRPGEVIRWSKAGLGTLICYEVIFPSLARRMAANGADLLVNLTNDAWYGRTSAPFQHFSLAVFRSIENRRTLIRAANTGISGFIDPTGRISDASELFVEAAIVRNVPVMDRMTFYTRFGDVFAWFCMAASALMLIHAFFRKP
jgi:apolipoprotein N-acyltransferase